MTILGSKDICRSIVIIWYFSPVDRVSLWGLPLIVLRSLLLALTYYRGPLVVTSRYIRFLILRTSLSTRYSFVCRILRFSYLLHVLALNFANRRRRLRYLLLVLFPK